MKALTHQQIKYEELQLLQTSGFSLAECSTHFNSNKILKQLTNSLKLTEIQRIKVSKVRSLGFSSNANLRSFSLALLISIYSVHLKEDLLEMIKSFIYHPTLDLNIIKHTPLPNVSSKQMKKLVVQFFYSLAYSNYDDKIEEKLCKYPIIMDILVIFLRCILIQLKAKHAQDYLLKLNTKDTFEALISFFDLNCMIASSMFLLYEDKLFLCQNINGEALIGHYCQNQNQKNINHEGNRRELSQLQEQIEEDTENERSERPSLASHNRSLQLRGIVSESIVFDPQAPTPFFNFQQGNNSSFQSSHDNSMHIDRPEYFLVQSTKETKPIKALDIIMHQSQTYVAFGNMKRTILENQLKESLQPKEALAMDSPITLDSPHTLFSEGNFAKPGENKINQIKVMKKSKSQSARPVSRNPSANNEQQSSSPANMKKKETIQIGKPTKMKKHKCQCIEAKRQVIKLHSNLYEINMMFVASPKMTLKKKQKTSLEELHEGNYYVNSKGLSCQLYAPYSQTISMQQIRQNYAKQKNKFNLNTSINSCYALPRVYKQSQTHSKRQFSPLSNVGERSFSPYGGTNSITSPKITFTYKNPLKYSIQFPKNKPKNKK